MSHHRFVIDQLSGPEGGGFIEEGSLFAALSIIGRPSAHLLRVVYNYAFSDQHTSAIHFGEAVKVVDQRARVGIRTEIHSTEQGALGLWNGCEERSARWRPVLCRRNGVDLIRHALLNQC